MVPGMRPRGLITVAWAVTALTFVALILFIFLKVPVAQPQAGGLSQKIFYFHVPAAYALYVSTSLRRTRCTFVAASASWPALSTSTHRVIERTLGRARAPNAPRRLAVSF
jgi:hypothetical protein